MQTYSTAKKAGPETAWGYNDGWLQARLGDANRNLAARVLHLIAQLAAAMGPPFDKAGRPLLVAGTALLNDIKKQVWPRLRSCSSGCCNEGWRHVGQAYAKGHELKLCGSSSGNKLDHAARLC